MPTSQKNTVETVNSLKSALQKHSTSDIDFHRILDILARLEELPINLAVLQETLIAKAVHVNLCKKANVIHDADVVQKAKALIQKWKSVAKASGVGATTSTKELEKEKKKKSVVPIPSPSSSEIGNGKKVSSKPTTIDLVRQDSGQMIHVQDHWKKDLPPVRRNICEKLMETLNLLDNHTNMPKEMLLELCANRADEIESCINDECNFITNKSGYTTKARQLAFNLKKNAPLREKVVMGMISSQDLVSMSIEELATNETRKERDKLVKEVSDSRRLDWDQANEKKINEICGIKGELLKASLFTCGRCKSTKTTSTQKQTRSADEPMTVFVWCMNCGNRWKC